MARLLITGGSSYLGQRLVPLAAHTHEICYTYYQNDPLRRPQGQRLDVRHGPAVSQLVAAFQPEVIIHTVGSNRSADMENVIRLGTAHVTQAARAAGARLVHISTDSIFDGRSPPYAESAPPTPVNDYGRAKADAEALARQCENHAIIRTSLIYGLRLMDHGTAWMAQALQAGQPVTLFANQRRNPIWVESLSRACLEMATHNFTGVLNVAGRQVMSRAEFALRLLDWWQVTRRETLAISAAAGQKWPLDCELDLSLATAVLTTPLPGVDEVLTAAQSR